MTLLDFVLKNVFIIQFSYNKNTCDLIGICTYLSKSHVVDAK